MAALSGLDVWQGRYRCARGGVGDRNRCAGRLTKASITAHSVRRNRVRTGIQNVGSCAVRIKDYAGWSRVGFRRLVDEAESAVAEIDCKVADVILALAEYVQNVRWSR